MIKCACGCGNALELYDNWGRTRKFIRGHNKGNLGCVGVRGANNGRWKGGITINWAGYRMVKKDGKYVKEHRLIFEQYYNCSLLPHIDIHHINGNRLDNRIENLQVLSHGEHSRLTNKKN